MSVLNQKTVFVLDHTQYFGISSEKPIDLDFFKNKGSLCPLSKSLWTFSVESSLEYCRIVWDLFPAGKLVRLIVSDSAAHVVNTWNSSTQNISYVTNAMSMVGVPQSSAHSSDHSVIHGLRAAIDALAEPSESQKEFDQKLQNKGRVICITSARDDKSMVSLEDIFHTVLAQHNLLATKQNDCLPINLCHLVIINITPMHMGLLVSTRGPQEISPHLTSEIHSVYASEVSSKLTHLILSHFDLASTTVTGIPMKEEQNANSSANYDVEIFHSKNSHTVIFGSEFLPTSVKEGSEYETVTLKWSTPRGCGTNDFQLCLAQDRVTPVDVTSRPSSCLINFLLNGRSVLLEMPRKSGGKQTSHLLSARGGEIFIHSLPLTRSCFEDFPSISEGSGGKVIDYRIADLSNLIKSNTLLPLKSSTERRYDENLQKARIKLCKRSTYFPLTLGLTIVYNMQSYLESLLTAIGKEELNDSDINQCQQIIFSILGLTNRQEPLPISLCQRFRSSKKEEQFKLLWNELELLIQSSGNSTGHKAVLLSLRECKMKCSEFSNNKPEVNQSINEIENLRENINNNIVIKATTDSPLSPILFAESASKSKRFLPYCGNRSLLGIISSSQKKVLQKRIEFSGRICTPTGQTAKLYPNVGKNERHPNKL
ncbi:protein asunder [Condylostylus longicornis]|uniref:protein asunder n=1 Tax=Condylostylus longicornis TaxID=2530218 RepID=UPI00244E21D9|nr:protein asunder [Condylostylus longicornis]